MKENKINPEELLKQAKKASENTYSPYSHFPVGAALLCADGETVTAANVENRSFGLTICAERSAIVKAISTGRKDFTALAICCPKADYPVSPCGACRQVISEFAPADMPVFFCGSDTGKRIETTVAELVPFDALSELKNGEYEDK